jgi:hypothetical protein
MDDEELALFFAAKKENEELKAKIERLETNLNSFVISSGHAEDYRRVIENNIIDRDQTIDKMKSFIKLLEQYPMFWGSSYKRSIKQFLDINFPER